MNGEIKTLWLAALRSGEYQQGMNYLRSDFSGKPRFCCLGVLCDIAEKAGVVEWKEAHLNDQGQEVLRGYFKEDQTHGGNGELPDAVMKWAGLDRHNPNVVYAGAKQSLAGLNDAEGLSFDTIATTIENQIP